MIFVTVKREQRVLNAEAQEEAVRRVLEAQDVALGDLMKSMDRHRYQTKARNSISFWCVTYWLPWIWKVKMTHG